MGLLWLAGGAPVAITIVGLAAVLARFIRWLSEFLARRLDARADRLEIAERSVELRMSKRLSHVEAELARYRLATMQLMSAVAEIAPTNPVLATVAQILREAMPFDLPDGAIDDLNDKLNIAPRPPDLIDDWTRAWKFASVQIHLLLLLGVALYEAVPAIPNELAVLIPERLRPLALGLYAALGILARVVRKKANG
jgi:phage tail protein X